ncbi:hypothetical protein MRX96_024862 [Rhipicephalus microplus]
MSENSCLPAATVEILCGTGCNCAEPRLVTETMAGVLPPAVVIALLTGSPRTWPVATATISCTVMVVVAVTTGGCGHCGRRAAVLRVATAVTCF